MPAAVVTDTRAARSLARPALIVAGLIVGAAFLWLVLELTRGPDMVPRVSIANPSSIDVEVDVSSTAGSGTLGLGRLQSGTRHAYEDVIDQGARWVFTISSPAGRLARLEVDRTTLVENDWTVRLPDNLARQDEATRSRR